MRCLSYYHSVVAPSLARELDSAFWISYIPRIAAHEPAARHAIFAISALHEDFDAAGIQRTLGRLDPRTAMTVRGAPKTEVSSGHAFALQHYNKAIRMVLEGGIASKEALLTVSVLFTCIELLHGSADAAFKHCQYGISLHSTGQLPSHLAATFSRLSYFPVLIESLTLPNLTRSQGEDECIPAIAVGEMQTTTQAREVLDAIMVRGAWVVRKGISVCDGQALYSTQELEADQFEIFRAMLLWWDGFAALKRSTSCPSQHDAAAFRLLETRWLVSKMLTEKATHRKDETISSENLCQFQRIVELAEQEVAARLVPVPPSEAGTRARSSFSFELGYSPFLYMVCLNCHQLSLRVRALVLLKALSCARETIWDACILYATGKWAIEYEHGLTLDEERMADTTNPYPDEVLPPDARRIVQSQNADEASLDVDSEGHVVVRRRICFHVAGPDGIVGPLWDYTTMRL